MPDTNSDNWYNIFSIHLLSMSGSILNNKGYAFKINNSYSTTGMTQTYGMNPVTVTGGSKGFYVSYIENIKDINYSYYLLYISQ